MKEKSTKIVVQFKDIPMNLYYGNETNVNPTSGIVRQKNERVRDAS